MGIYLDCERDEESVHTDIFLAIEDSAEVGTNCHDLPCL